MKEIDSQLYGYSYELDTTSESDGTKCFAVDTGTVFVAYKGVWYEQSGSFWAASIPESENDLIGTSWEIGKITPADDLLVLNVIDTGKRYVSFNGKWYEQPVAWSAPAPAGAGLGADPFIVTLTPVDSDFSGFMDKNGAEIRSAYEAGKRIIFDIPTMHATVELQTTSLYDQDGIDTLDADASFWYEVLGQDYLMTIHTYGNDLESPTYDVQWFVLTPATNG